LRRILRKDTNVKKARKNSTQTPNALETTTTTQSEEHRTTENAKEREARTTKDLLNRGVQKSGGGSAKATRESVT